MAKIDHLEEAKASLYHSKAQRDNGQAAVAAQIAIAHALVAVIERLDQLITTAGYRTTRALELDPDYRAASREAALTAHLREG